MKPSVLKQQGGVTESEGQAATAYDGEDNTTKGGWKTNGSEHKVTKNVRTAWARATAMLSLESGDGVAGRRPGEIMVPVFSLEALHWSKVKKRQKPPSSLQCSSQSARLKQIVLLQLDLIEQQQHQLHLKEREIDELKAEKETLLARLERMKRRMQLVKKDNEKDKCRLIPGVVGIEEKNVTESEKIHHQQMTLEQPLAEADTNQTEMYSGKGNKRKSVPGTERKAPVKKLVAEFSRVQTKLAKSPQFRQAASGPLPDKVSKQSKEIPEKYKSQTWEGHKSSVSPGLPISKDQSVCNDIEEEPYLCTTEMYLCQWYQRPPSFLQEASPKKEEIVPIPSWKEHLVEPLLDVQPSEIFENLDDCVFTKRHAKFELDEKRRKRWDIQRIREQRVLQRLQLRMYKKKGLQESESEILSFFPETDDVESLVITPFLPVVAFGRPLPKLSQQNFGLPWLDERSRCRIEIYKKQTPHRTCRK